MPSTLAPAAALPEPTLRDILDAVNGLGTEVAELKTRFDGLEKRFDGLEAKVDGLETRFDGLEKRFDGLETRFDGLETRFDGLETRFDGLEKRFDGLEAKVDGLETRFDGLEKRFDGLETRFDRLETRFDALEAEVGELRTEVAALTDLSRQQFAHTTGEIAALKAEGAQVRQQLEVLDRRTSEMHVEVAKIDGIETVTILTRSEVDNLTRIMRQVEPQVAETLKLGQDSRKLGQKLQEDLARLDRKIDRHIDDREIHLPRPRTLDLPAAGPIAA